MAVVPAAAAAALLAIDIAETVLIQIVGQLVSQTLSAALAPEFGGLQTESFRLNPTAPLSVADAVAGVIRGHITEDAGREEARLWGISDNTDTTTFRRFSTLLANAGEPLPLLTLTEAWRRNIIPKQGTGADSVSLEQGIRESQLKNKWIPIVEALQFQVAPVGTIVEGALRAQISIPDAVKLAFQQGIDEATFTLMFKSAGRPPSPQELATLWHRGVIPEGPPGGDNLTLAQGYKETDLKDKWYEPWKAGLEYRPPPRTITALQRSGALSDADALKLLQEEGLSADMAALYVKAAHHERSAATRELTKAELVGLYVDQATTAEDLTKALIARGYTAADAALEVELADLKVKRALEQRAVNRVGSLYIGRKIDKAAAMTTLQSLKLPGPQIDRLIQIWGLERGDNFKHLTPAEIGDAVKYAFLTPDQGLAEMAILGYSPRDAWLVLSDHLKGPVTPTMPTSTLPPA